MSHLNLGKINIKSNTCFFSLLLISKHELLYKNYRKISIHIATGIFFPHFCATVDQHKQWNELVFFLVLCMTNRIVYECLVNAKIFLLF